MKAKILLFGTIFVLFSCSRKQKPQDIYNPSFYIRVTSPADSLKNMYVVYNCTKDMRYKMFKFYWDNGKIQSISFFLNNIKVGPWVGYFDNGNLSFEQGFLDGKNDGDYRVIL